MRSQARSRSPASMSRNEKTPTGPAGVVRVEVFRTLSGSMKRWRGGTGDSEIKVSPSARNSRSSSLCFFLASFAARLVENVRPSLAI